MIKYVIKNDLMPSWALARHIGSWKNDLSLTAVEKEKLLKWLDEGLPYENKDIRLFNPKAESSGIKDPDYVMKLESVEIPATGFLPYKWFIFETNFKEDKWIKEIEFVLKPKVTHHLSIRIVDNKYLSQVKKESILNMSILKRKRPLVAWTLGRSKHKNFGENTGIKIDKNSFLVMWIHYEPIGKKVIDSTTRVKFKFHTKKPKFSRFIVTANNKNFTIPPYHNNYPVESKFKFKRDIKLLSISPHMHLRGKASAVFITNPKGKTKEIFRLNSYNFNFQIRYILKKPLLISKDSILSCRNWFDNSTNNPINPDPSKSVKRGNFTTDEMSVCFLSFIIPSSEKVDPKKIWTVL